MLYYIICLIFGFRFFTKHASAWNSNLLVFCQIIQWIFKTHFVIRKMFPAESSAIGTHLERVSVVVILKFSGCMGNKVTINLELIWLSHHSVSLTNRLNQTESAVSKFWIQFQIIKTSKRDHFNTLGRFFSDWSLSKFYVDIYENYLFTAGHFATIHAPNQTTVSEQIKKGWCKDASCCVSQNLLTHFSRNVLLIN